MIRKFSLFLSACLFGILLPLQAQTQTCFRVSPDGNDDADGSSAHPWRTPEAAAKRVQAYMQAHPGQPVQLEFALGTYQLKEPLTFRNLDAPLTLTALYGDGSGAVPPGEPAAAQAPQPVFSGERILSGWQPVTDPSVLQMMPPQAAGRVLQLDLGKAGVTDLGDPTDRENRVDLYRDGKRQILARWPDRGFTQAGLAIGGTDVEDTWIHVHGTREGILEYEDARMEHWMQEQDPRLFGYWYWDWADKYHKLAALDPERKTFTVNEPWSHYGYRDSCRFYGLNLICELDAPGEYYIDRKTGMIYWIAPEDGKTGETALSVFAAPAMIIAENCKGLTVTGLAFEGGRRGAVQVTGGEDNVVRDCRFARFGETVLRFQGGHGHKVKGCFLTELGCGGIWMLGGDRQALEPSGFEVSDNIVEHFSLFKRTNEPAVHFHGVGFVCDHNRFQYASSSSMRMEGNEIRVEYNQCFNLAEESDDQGGFDTFMDYSYRGMVLRYNHWRDIKDGMFAGAAGIRLDDLISGQLVFGNIFERCGGGGWSGGGGFGGVQINGGRDNRIFNNLFFDCPHAVSGGAFQGEKWFTTLDSELSRQYQSRVDITTSLWKEKYPEMLPHLHSPEGHNYVERNLAVNAKGLLLQKFPGFVTGGNTVLKSVHPLEYFLKPSVQKEFGLEPIPFEEIGVRENRWK